MQIFERNKKLYLMAISFRFKIYIKMLKTKHVSYRFFYWISINVTLIQSQIYKIFKNIQKYKDGWIYHTFVLGLSYVGMKYQSTNK